METLDKPALKALTTSTRQEIMKLLAKRPYTASELSKILGRHVTTVAEHLEVLEKSGLAQRKEGSKWVYYSLTQKGVNLFKPSYSWSVVFSLSCVLLLAGGWLYAFSGQSAVEQRMTQEAAKITAPAVAAQRAAEAGAAIGILFIVLGIAGFAYLAIQRLKGRSLLHWFSTF